MNLHSSAIKTCALITLGFAINVPIEQALAQETNPSGTQSQIETPKDPKATKPTDAQKTKPKISPLPLTRPVELGDRPTRTLNRFAPTPIAESGVTKAAEANSQKLDACTSGETKGKVSESKKSTASKKTNRGNHCRKKN